MLTQSFVLFICKAVQKTKKNLDFVTDLLKKIPLFTYFSIYVSLLSFVLSFEDLLLHPH